MKVNNPFRSIYDAIKQTYHNRHNINLRFPLPLLIVIIVVLVGIVGIAAYQDSGGWSRSKTFQCQVLNLGITSRSFVIESNSQADAVSHCLKVTENWGNCNCTKLEE